MRHLILFTLLASGFAYGSTNDGQALAAENSYLTELKTRSTRIELSKDPQWLKLLHYKPGFFTVQSQVASPNFFLSKKGQSDAEAELNATLESFFETSPRHYELNLVAKGDAQFPRCQFPARYLYLKAKLSIDETRLPKADCSRFEKFRDGIAVKAASLVFSSYYVNNPSSAFGHSFLRLSRNPLGTVDSEKFQLLDRGINFAAEVTTNNAVLYAIYGIIGAFPGTYTNIPYYYKVREYNDFESRDLWSYDLGLTQDELDLLVAHIWELGPAYFRYYYFSQNCSYQILTALEAAAPRFEITSKLAFYVIPADTVRALVDTPDLVKQIHYRPSITSVFENRISLMSKEQREILVTLTNQKLHPTQLQKVLPQKTDQAAVLDAALDFMDMTYAKELATPESNAGRLKQEMLISRAELGIQTAPLPHETPSTPPHLGHRSARMELAQGNLKTLGPYTQLGLRFALHDWLDPAAGYPENSQIEMLNIRSRYFYDSKNPTLESLGLFSIATLSPLSPYRKEWSWKVNLGLNRRLDSICNHCLSGQLNAGGGVTFNLAKKTAFYLMADVDLQTSPSFKGAGWRIAPGPLAGVLVSGERIRLLVQSSYLWETGYGSVGLKPRLSFDAEARAKLASQWALGAKFHYESSNRQGIDDAGLHLYHYF